MAEEAWRSARPDLAVISADLPDGLISQLLPRLRAIDPSIPVIVLAACSSLGLAIEALRMGAEHFLTKPVEPVMVATVIERSLENQRNQRLRLAGMAVSSHRSLDPFLGKSNAIKALHNHARRVAAADSPVLIQGETGAGKGVLAHWLHQNSPRAPGPFVELNCTVPRASFEAEMFGDDRVSAPFHARGPSAVEVAHHGTLFLNAIDNFDPLMHPRLLRLLGESQFRRLGGAQDRWVDVRVFGGTHRPLNWLLQPGQSNQFVDLKSQPILISVPPLRQRAEDIPALAHGILNRLTEELGTDSFTLSRSALAALQGYSWPGNIRELSIVLERAGLVASNCVLTERDLDFDLLSEQNVSAAGQPRTLEEFERHYIHQVLRKEGGHVESAARKLGIPRSSLYHKLKQYRQDKPA